MWSARDRRVLTHPAAVGTEMRQALAERGGQGEVDVVPCERAALQPEARLCPLEVLLATL